MEPRERVLAALAGREPDKVPKALSFYRVDLAAIAPLVAPGRIGAWMFALWRLSRHGTSSASTATFTSFRWTPASARRLNCALTASGAIGLTMRSSATPWLEPKLWLIWLTTPGPTSRPSIVIGV